IRSFIIFFLFAFAGAPHLLHSFPTRRSSDLSAGSEVADEVAAKIVGLEPVEEDRLARVGSRVQVTVDESRRHELARGLDPALDGDRKSTRLNSSHQIISYAVFCLKKKKTTQN